MRTLVLEPVPVEVEALIAKRQRLGLDTYDEIWEGTYHMSPAPRFRHSDLDQQLAEILGPVARRAGLVAGGVFNLGALDDFRVPDRGVHRGWPDPDVVWFATAAMVVEIVSPGDESYEKLGFYAEHQVDEVLIVDPEAETVHLLVLAGDHYQASVRSNLLGVDAEELGATIRWS